jgi:hypothetical protein
MGLVHNRAELGLGILLDFNVLRYNIAVVGEEIGCICQSMIDNDKEELNEGGKYLQAFDNTFDPENKSTRDQYSFQLIREAFDAFGLEKYIKNIIEIIVFDAVMGNSDRHQENWAFITKNTPIQKFIAKSELALIIKLYFQNVTAFSPIYDNGSSLGRELTHEKAARMLKNREEFDSYIKRGPSEIHWNGQKLNHFELIGNLLNSEYADIARKLLSKVIERFDGIKVALIVNEIDNLVPEKQAHYRLPDARKQYNNQYATFEIRKIEGTFPW